MNSKEFGRRKRRQAVRAWLNKNRRPPPKIPDGYVSPKDAGAAVGYSYSWCVELARNARIRAVRIRRRWYIELEDLRRHAHGMQ